MPSPLSSRGRGNSSNAKSSNIFSRWMERRKERRMEAEEEAAKLITNAIVKNQNTIIDKLSSIDFLHSRLPKSVLEAKSSENQRCCDLELATKVIIQTLVKDPQIIKMDIRQFDQKLLTLVLLFKQAVEQGDVRAAYAAKAGLIRAVKDIRSRIPQNQPELARQFVEVNTNYLDQWITLVSLAQVTDRTKQNVDDQRKRHILSEEKDNESTEKLRKQIMEDPAFAVAFNELRNREGDEDRSKWNSDQKEVHRLMVERRMDKVNLDLNSLLLQQQEMALTTKIGQLDVLHAQVASLPIVADPNLLTKFQDSVNDLIKKLAEIDNEIDETLKTMDDIEGRIQQLSRAPGSLRAQEVAAEEAENALQELKKLENDQSGKTAEKARKMREEMGLHTAEQLAEMKKQVELAEQRAIEELRQQMSEQQMEQEQELLTN